MQRNHSRVTNSIWVKETTGLLSAIGRAQEQAICHPDLEKICNTFLNDLLKLTESSHGFIGEIRFDAENLPALKTIAVVTRPSNDKPPALYKKTSLSQKSVFPNLDNLVDSIIEKGEALILHKPKKRPRTKRSSRKTPTLDTFLGCPIYFRKKLIGIIGFANRPEGYDERLIQYLEPVLKLYKQIFLRDRRDRQRRQSEAALKTSQTLLKKRVKEERIHLAEMNKQLKDEIEQHKKTQAILYREHHFSAALVNTLDVLVVVLDKQGRIIRFNKTCETLTGYSFSEVKNRHLWACFLDREKSGTLKLKIQALMRGTVSSQSYELVWQTKDGAKTHIVWSNTVLRDTSDRVEFILGTGIDITQRKRIEQQSFDRYQRLKKLTELSLTGSSDSYDVFRKIVSMVANILNVPVVCLSEVRGDDLYFSCIYANGEISVDAGHTPLNTAPCGTVKEKKDVTLFDNVAVLFPEVEVLKKFNAYSYCGFPSLDNNGNVVAVTCLVDDKPHHFKEEDKDLLRILGQRIATEIERKKHHIQGKKAEQILKASEEKWRSLTQHSPDQILMLDRAFKIQFVNHVISSLTMDQVIGAPMLHFVAKKFKTKAKLCYERVWRTAQPERLETEFRDSKGENHYFEENVGPIMDDGKVTALIVCARNVTTRKHAEAKLRLFAAVFENTAEGVIITDSKKNITAVNKAFTEITGYSEEEALEKNPRFLKSDRHDHHFYKKMWLDINNKGMWQGEIWDRRKNGEVYPAWSTITALHDDSGKLSNYISVFSDISTIKRSQEQMDFLAFHDPLTNLPNRILFNDRLESAIHRAKREGNQLAVLFLDLDRFKNVNDSLGHPIGDILLKKAAHRISQVVREQDTVARLGGDEFIIIVNDIHDPQDVAVLAQKLMATFHEPIDVKGHELHLTVSMGISLFPDDGQDTATLVKNADAAMYRAKEEGRNDYQFYTSKLTTDVFERLTMETALRHALDHNELILHYQPQYLLGGPGQLMGAEALIRWQHPKKGLLFPAKFIPLAEDSGLIMAIGEWVLMEACMQMRSWQKAGLHLDRIAVNVSSLQFQRSDIVKTVSRVLEKTGLSPEYLDLELTESVIMQKTNFIGILDDLKKLGVTLSIDDFGTGYSSLSYLKRLPIDTLKIDGSFVRDIPIDTNDEAITRAIIALGKSLQINLIAEGVETEEQRIFLKSLGCDEAQGFLYSKPVIADQFVALFENQKS